MPWDSLTKLIMEIQLKSYVCYSHNCCSDRWRQLTSWWQGSLVIITCILPAGGRNEQLWSVRYRIFATLLKLMCKAKPYNMEDEVTVVKCDSLYSMYLWIINQTANSRRCKNLNIKHTSSVVNSRTGYQLSELNLKAFALLLVISLHVCHTS